MGRVGLCASSGSVRFPDVVYANEFLIITFAKKINRHDIFPS
jgi:hypothetical protein